jgi:hypothetical protein
MTKVQISTAAELQEARLLIEHYRNRNLILSQVIVDQGVTIAEREGRIAELEASVQPADVESPEIATGAEQPASEGQVH